MIDVKQHKQELSLIGELMVNLVMKGLSAKDISSILYETYVIRLDDEDEVKQRNKLNEIIDVIIDFQRKYIYTGRR